MGSCCFYQKDKNAIIVPAPLFFNLLDIVTCVQRGGGQGLYCDMVAFISLSHLSPLQEPLSKCIFLRLPINVQIHQSDLPTCAFATYQNLNMVPFKPPYLNRK